MKNDSGSSSLWNSTSMCSRFGSSSAKPVLTEAMFQPFSSRTPARRSARRISITSVTLTSNLLTGISEVLTEIETLPRS